MTVHCCRFVLRLLRLVGVRGCTRDLTRRLSTGTRDHRIYAVKGKGQRASTGGGPAFSLQGVFGLGDVVTFAAWRRLKPTGREGPYRPSSLVLRRILQEETRSILNQRFDNWYNNTMIITCRSQITPSPKCFGFWSPINRSYS